MKQLTLEHLAPYLPYGLKIYIDSVGNYKIFELIQFSTESNCVWGRIDKNSSGWVQKFKPILRPLSDLTKEIEHKGERFVPHDELGLFQSKYHSGNNLENHNGYVFPVLNLTYKQVQKLFEWHFDVFGLIDAGLAIYINTLPDAT